MFQRRPRKFRRYSNSRNHVSRGDSSQQNRSRLNPYLNGQARSKFRNSLSAERMLEKYNSLAKEAMSSGDKTLAENYLQHADHFMRTIKDKNRNKVQDSSNVTDKLQDSSNVTDKLTADEKHLPSNGNIDQDHEIKK